MLELAPLIKDLAVILAVASVVSLVFQKIRQPVVLGYLIAGLIVGPHTPPPFVSDLNALRVLAELGVIFLMFSLGLEFSFHKLAKVGFSATITGIFEVLFMLAIGFTVGRLIGWSTYNSLFLGATLSISSTTIIIKAFDELKLKRKPFAQLVFGILIIEDLIAILLLVALSTVVVTNNIFSFAIIGATVKLILVVGGWFLIGYFIVPPLLRKMLQFTNHETLTVVSIALCLLLVYVAAYFHYSVALGAFIMGSILAEAPQVQRIEQLVNPIRDIFAAVFFVSVGILINPYTIWEHFQLVLLISATTILGKLIITGIGALLSGQSVNTSLRVGFSMAQIGEFSFIIAGLGVTLGVTNKELYPIIVAAAAITTFSTPYLIRFSGYLGDQLDRYSTDSAWFRKNRAKNHNPDENVNTLKTPPFYRRATLRFLSCSIIVGLVFLAVQHFLLKNIYHTTQITTAVKFLDWLIALACASPFIFGMITAFKTKDGAEENRWSLRLFLAWMLTAIQITLLSKPYFSSWSITVIVMGVSIILLITLYRPLKTLNASLQTMYDWFEQRMIANLQKNEPTEQNIFKQLAPWNTQFKTINIAESSLLTHKTLGECQLRKQFKVNVVAIQRGSKIVAAPHPNERLMANDTLIVLGLDEHVDHLRNIAEQDCLIDEANHLEKFTLVPLLIAANHLFVGKTLREINIYDRCGGLVVGLQRTGKRFLNPDSNTVLEAEDLLLIIGDEERIKNLEQ